MDLLTCIAIVAFCGCGQIVQSQSQGERPPGAPANPQNVEIVFSRGQDTSLRKEGFLREGSASLELFPQQVNRPSEWADLFNEGTGTGSLPTFERPPPPPRQRVREREGPSVNEHIIRNVNERQRPPIERRVPPRVNERRHIQHVNEPPHIPPVNERRRNQHVPHVNEPPRIPLVDERRHNPQVNELTHIPSVNDRRHNPHVNEPTHIPFVNERRHNPQVNKPPHVTTMDERRHHPHVNGRRFPDPTVTRMVLTGSTRRDIPDKNHKHFTSVDVIRGRPHGHQRRPFQTVHIKPVAPTLVEKLHAVVGNINNQVRNKVAPFNKARQNTVREVTKVHHSPHKRPATEKERHSVPEVRKLYPTGNRKKDQISAIVDKLTHGIQHLTGQPHSHDHKPTSFKNQSIKVRVRPILNSNYGKKRVIFRFGY